MGSNLICCGNHKIKLQEMYCVASEINWDMKELCSHWPPQRSVQTNYNTVIEDYSVPIFSSLGLHPLASVDTEMELKLILYLDLVIDEHFLIAIILLCSNSRPWNWKNINITLFITIIVWKSKYIFLFLYTLRGKSV